jgi:TIR domain
MRSARKAAAAKNGRICNKDGGMHIYISYAKSDEAFARSLSSQLAKRGLSVWSAHEEVLPGDNIWLRTGEALKRSKAMIVLVSPDSMQSEHVRREIEYALGDTNYQGRVFPVQVRPTKNVPWIFEKFRTFDAKQGPANISGCIAEALKREPLKGGRYKTVSVPRSCANHDFSA